MIPPVSITGTHKENNVVYYEIIVKLPLRSIAVSKRYSDFVNFVNTLCKSLGIRQDQLDYKLPPKSGSSWFSSNQTIVEERKIKLANFLNAIVRDKELQNHQVVHDFLNLPINFKFNANSSLPTRSIEGIEELGSQNPNSIDINSWLELYRKVKFYLVDLKEHENDSVAHKMDSKLKIDKYIEPSIKILQISLENLNLDPIEKSKRTGWIKELKAQVSREATGQKSIFQTSTRDTLFSDITKNAPSKRALGKPVQETNDTLPLNNKELLQQQIQVHSQQDRDVEELRKLVQRQKEIGQLINQEVSEQNEILDEFNEQIENAQGKLQNARNRTRNLG